jgi:chemotaxis protein methyltransferase WspC
MADFEIEALLQKAMGLKVTSIGKPTLDRSVERRMKALSIDDKDAYVEKLKSSAHELKELIEEVVIPETWFFRDQEPFKAMIQYLVTQWAPIHQNNLFKVLSIPCSTGEEPYSLTMSLLSSGWPVEISRKINHLSLIIMFVTRCISIMVMY